jgi:hypothetical protein
MTLEKNDKEKDNMSVGVILWAIIMGKAVITVTWIVSSVYLITIEEKTWALIFFIVGFIFSLSSYKSGITGKDKEI